MINEKIKENEIINWSDYTPSYEFKDQFRYEDRVSNEYIEEKCKKFGISYNNNGLKEIESKFENISTKSMTETDKEIMFLYHHLYIKLIRDSFGIKENKIILKDDLLQFFVIGKIEGKVLLLDGTFIFNNLFCSEKRNPSPDEFCEIFKDYIDSFHVFNEFTEGKYLIYGFGHVIPLCVEDIPVHVQKEIYEFLAIEN
jgi:hypothetical protein